MTRSASPASTTIKEALDEDHYRKKTNRCCLTKDVKRERRQQHDERICNPLCQHLKRHAETTNVVWEYFGHERPEDWSNAHNEKRDVELRSCLLTKMVREARCLHFRVAPDRAFRVNIRRGNWQKRNL